MPLSVSGSAKARGMLTAVRQRLSGEGGRVFSRFAWSLSNVFANFGLRLGSAVVLSRLLDPHAFGTMVLLNSMRLGIELLTAVGIEQNIVRHKDGLEPRFFNTAWTLQIIRGVIISVVFLALAPALAKFYEVDVRAFIAIAFAPLLTSLHSTSIFALIKNLEVKRRTLFELRSEFIGFVASVALALITPTVWALVFGYLISVAARSLMSYWLPHPKHQLTLDRSSMVDILSFGRWIMISCVVMFAASNLDRLTLGKMMPLALFGIYGMARNIADIPPSMARRLTDQVIFPMLSNAKAHEETPAIVKLNPVHLKLVLACAAITGAGIGSADWAINLMYDSRYASAGWMLSLLLFSAWLSILSTFNEGVLLGSGKPVYQSGGNVLRFCILGLGLWFGYQWMGLVGAICALIAGELGRYIFVQVGQQKFKLSFLRHDLIATLLMLVVLALWVGARILLGLGTPWNIPIEALEPG